MYLLQSALLLALTFWFIDIQILITYYYSVVKYNALFVILWQAIFGGRDDKRNSSHQDHFLGPRLFLNFGNTSNDDHRLIIIILLC